MVNFGIAIEALKLEKDWYIGLNKEYKQRRKLVWAILDELQCKYSKESTGLFVWAKIPTNYKNGEDFSDYLLHEKGIFATPGIVFGSNGENYIRLSYATSDENILRALEIMGKVL